MQVSQWPLAVVAVTLLTALARVPAAAATPADHAHDPLTMDPSLTLGDVVEVALAAYPGLLVQRARGDQAEAWSRRGRSWIADRPSLMLRYQSDRWGTDAGLAEYEAGVELPLWSWGGKRAVTALGQALTAESEAAATALRWEVAGLVREALWNVALAENAHELAEQSLEMAARLAETVERRHQLGDVALRDVLLARSSYLEYQTALIEASATLLDAERIYRTYTGLDRRPEFSGEALGTVDEITAEHPALVLADIAIERAEADTAVARKITNSGATLLIGTRRERPPLGASFDESVGVTVNVPFGGGGQRDTAIAAAARAAAEARSARNQQLRQLTLALHEAAHGLTVVRQNIAAATERRDLAERQQTMGESAYEKGEIELLDLLKIQETAIAARRQLTQLQIDEKRQKALLNQAVGELP